MTDISPVVIKLGGVTVQGEKPFGSNEQCLLEECRNAPDLGTLYKRLTRARNEARGERLAQIGREIILPLKEQGKLPVVVISAFERATDKLEEMVECIAGEHPDPWERARLVMTGELRANSALALALNALGCPARSLTGREAGVMTRAQDGPVQAGIEKVDPTRIQELIRRGIVPVIAGFQGYYEDETTGYEEVSILGRGGSDLTAVAVAHALGLTECTKYTDEEGLYDKDPRKHADARKVPRVTADELLTWDPFPKVIQKASVQYAQDKGVDIWIRSSFQPTLEGSLIQCRV